jgi:hypothetical protein
MPHRMPDKDFLTWLTCRISHNGLNANEYEKVQKRILAIRDRLCAEKGRDNVRTNIDMGRVVSSEFDTGHR